MPSQSMSALADQASKLLDFSQKLDINLLDNVVGCLYNGEGPQVRIREREEGLGRAHLYGHKFPEHEYTG